MSTEFIVGHNIRQAKHSEKRNTIEGMLSTSETIFSRDIEKDAANASDITKQKDDKVLLLLISVRACSIFSLLFCSASRLIYAL